MQYRIQTFRVNSRVWQWDVFSGSEHVAGGYCRTKADCLHDANLWIEGRQWKCPVPIRRSVCAS